MNAVEIEEAVSALAEGPFDAAEFPYQFLTEAVGDVVRRLSNEVRTPGLVKLTAITVADCESMRLPASGRIPLVRSCSMLVTSG